MNIQAKSKQELVTQFRRGEILAAARRIFVEKGFRDATIDQIAEAAGLAKGTVYLYFPSKHEIHVAVLETVAEGYLLKVQDSVTNAASVRDAVYFFALCLIEHLQANKDFILVSIAEFGRYASIQALPEPLRRINRHQTELLQRALERGVQAGEVRPDTPIEPTAKAIRLLVKNWAVERMAQDTDVPAADDARMLSDLVWRGVSQ